MEDQREDSLVVVVPNETDDTNWHFAGTTVHPFVRDTNHRMQLEIENRFVVLMVNPFSPSKKAEKKDDDENDDTDDVQHHHTTIFMLRRDVLPHGRAFVARGHRGRCVQRQQFREREQR